MIYKIKAKFNYDKAQEYYQKLSDGTIKKQRPDGPEIVKAMNRATIDKNGDINWTELCYCQIPLYHERTTIYDTYFTAMKIEPIAAHTTFEGKAFIESIAIY